MKSPQLPGAGRTREGHHHRSHTPTSPGAILLSKMTCQPQHIGCQCITFRSPLRCHFSNVVISNPICLVHIPNSLTTRSFSGTNLYTSQIFAMSFFENIKRKMSSSMSRGKLFSINSALSMLPKAEMSTNQNSLLIRVLFSVCVQRIEYFSSNFLNQ